MNVPNLSPINKHVNGIAINSCKVLPMTFLNKECNYVCTKNVTIGVQKNPDMEVGSTYICTYVPMLTANIESLKKSSLVALPTLKKNTFVCMYSYVMFFYQIVLFISTKFNFNTNAYFPVPASPLEQKYVLKCFQ
jgi:hypothetical protein